MNSWSNQDGTRSVCAGGVLMQRDVTAPRSVHSCRAPRPLHIHL